MGNILRWKKGEMSFRRVHQCQGTSIAFSGQLFRHGELKWKRKFYMSDEIQQLFVTSYKIRQKKYRCVKVTHQEEYQKVRPYAPDAVR